MADQRFKNCVRVTAEFLGVQTVLFYIKISNLNALSALNKYFTRMWSAKTFDYFQQWAFLGFLRILITEVCLLYMKSMLQTSH